MELDVRALVDFTCARQRPEGGFATVPSLPATIEDSFFASEILLLLEELEPSLSLRSLVDVARLAHFIRDKYAEEKSRLPLRLRYFLQRIQLNFPELSLALENVSVSRPLSFENLFYLRQLGQVDDRELTSPPRLELEEVSCREVYFYLALFAESPYIHRQELVGWLRACQNGDGGFGFFPGSTSFLENCFYCLSSLALLGAAPSAPQQARTYILSCQTGAGGFARSFVGAPFLESSWHGVELFCGPLFAVG